MLEWQTASENNNDGFNVERSTDADYWKSLDFVPGHGTTFSPQIYQYTDRYPVPGTNYYRLQQVDYYGHFKYSPIVSIYYEKGQTGLKLYPNPVWDGRIMLEYPGDEPATVHILDGAGRIVFEQVIIGSSNMAFNLPPGIYFVRVTSLRNKWVNTLVVQ